MDCNLLHFLTGVVLSYFFPFITFGVFSSFFKITNESLKQAPCHTYENAIYRDSVLLKCMRRRQFRYCGADWFGCNSI